MYSKIFYFNLKQSVGEIIVADFLGQGKGRKPLGVHGKRAPPFRGLKSMARRTNHREFRHPYPPVRPVRPAPTGLVHMFILHVSPLILVNVYSCKVIGIHNYGEGVYKKGREVGEVKFDPLGRYSHCSLLPIHVGSLMSIFIIAHVDMSSLQGPV